MGTVLGLFEDPNHVKGATVALKQAGFSESEFKILGKEYITEEASRATRYQRAGSLLGIIGTIVGGYAGIAIGAVISELFGGGAAFAMGTLGIILVIFLGAAIGAIAGAVFGAKVVPALMKRLNAFGDTAESSRQGTRDGILLAVDTTEANETTAKEIMKRKEAVSVEVSHKTGRTELLQPV